MWARNASCEKQDISRDEMLEMSMKGVQKSIIAPLHIFAHSHLAIEKIIYFPYLFTMPPSSCQVECELTRDEYGK